MIYNITVKNGHFKNGKIEKKDKTDFWKWQKWENGQNGQNNDALKPSLNARKRTYWYHHLSGPVKTHYRASQRWTIINKVFHANTNNVSNSLRTKLGPSISRNADSIVYTLYTIRYWHNNAPLSVLPPTIVPTMVILVHV